MASGRSSLTLLSLCSVVLLLLLVDVTAAVDQQAKRETGIVGSTQEFYLRGNPITPTEKASEEAEESFESFERRELVDDGYDDGSSPSAGCSSNCDVVP